MAKLDFQLGEFPKGYFLFWTVSTHCENVVHVKLQDGNETIFRADKKDSDSTLKVISQQSGEISKDCPILSIEVEGSNSLQQSMVSGLIADDKSRRVGFVYDYCIESGNNDTFDDVYVNIVGWKQKG